MSKFIDKLKTFVFFIAKRLWIALNYFIWVLIITPLIGGFLFKLYVLPTEIMTENTTVERLLTTTLLYMLGAYFVSFIQVFCGGFLLALVIFVRGRILFIDSICCGFLGALLGFIIPTDSYGAFGPRLMTHEGILSTLTLDNQTLLPMLYLSTLTAAIFWYIQDRPKSNNITAKSKPASTLPTPPAAI